MTLAAEQIDPRRDDIVRAMRLAVTSSPDATFMLDREGAILLANPALCGSLRADESRLLGHPIDLSAGSTDPQRFREKLRAALDGTTSRYRTTGVDPLGSSYIAEITLVPIRIDDVVVAVLGTALDTTAAEQRESEVRRDEDLLRLVGRLARFGGWSIDAETRAVSFSEGARHMLGIPDGVPDLTSIVWAMFPDEHRGRVAALLEQCLTTGEPYDIETIMVSSAGERLTIRTVAEAEVLGDGRIVGAHGAMWDITETVVARARERALESRLSNTLNAISDGIIFLDHNAVTTYVNQHAVEMWRTTEESLKSGSLWDIFPGADAAGFRASFDRARANGERDVYRALYAPYGRWFETAAYPTEDGLAVYVRDVTADEETQALARRLLEQLKQQAALLDTASDAMIVRDLDNRVLYWNHAAEKLYGWSSEEAVGQWVGDLMYADGDLLERMTEQVMQTGYLSEEVEQRTRDGRTVIVDCRWQLIKDDDGHPTSIFAVKTDITEYRRQQDAHFRTQRMEALGTLGSGIAHDINNILTPILMSAQLLRSDDDDAARRELISTIETAVKRGAEMIRQVLSFARGVEGRRIVIDIGRLLDDLTTLTGDMLPKGITLEIDRATDLPTTVGDPTQLLQVLVNLVTNAKDAMGASGLLRISATPLDITDQDALASGDAAAGSYVTISVEDDGHGMSADVIDRIFEPFYTTKLPSKGTGLGLSTSLAILRAHNGFIQVDSTQGRGTRFTVGMPIKAAPRLAELPSPATLLSLPAGDGELVLVVDDDASIRTITSKTLQAHGYRTVLASNGREAIEIIERGTERVDLVLTDMMMPVMDGAATSAYLEEHHPSIPIIAASGLGSGGRASHAVGMGITRFIAKPYTTSLLLTTVRDTLLAHRAPDEEAS